MKSLEQAAENVFEKGLEEASRENVIQFVGDTINRIDANDPTNLYKSDNALLKTTFATYQAGVADQEQGDQKVSTEGVKGVLNRLYSVADKLEDKINSVFGRKSLKLIEFFPRGKGFVRRAKRGEVATVIGNLLVKAKLYETDLGTAFVTDLTALSTDWAAALKTQSGEKSSVDQGRGKAEASVSPMAVLLNRIFLKVRLNNEGKEKAAVAVYFDETPLLRKQSSDHDGLGRSYGTVVDAVSGNTLADVSIRILDGKNKLVWTGKTDKDGNWRTSNLAIGLYTFVFEKIGFLAQSLAHEILDYKDTELDVKLSK